MRANNILPARLSSQLSNINAHNQFSGFLASNLGGEKSDPSKKLRDISSNTHHGFLKIEIVRAVNKLSSLDSVLDLSYFEFKMCVKMSSKQSMMKT